MMTGYHDKCGDIECHTCDEVEVLEARAERAENTIDLIRAMGNNVIAWPEDVDIDSYRRGVYDLWRMVQILIDYGMETL